MTTKTDAVRACLKEGGKTMRQIVEQIGHDHQRTVLTMAYRGKLTSMRGDHETVYSIAVQAEQADAETYQPSVWRQPYAFRNCSACNAKADLYAAVDTDPLDAPVLLCRRCVSRCAEILARAS